MPLIKQSLREIADLVGGEVIGNDQLLITGVNSLDNAVDGDISFFLDSRLLDQVKETKASALLLSEWVDVFSGPQIVVPNPKLAYARVASIFARPISRFPGISNEAVIDETCLIGRDASIYPLVYIGKDTVIGDGVTFFPGTFIGDRVRIGSGTVIYPNVTVLQDCIIGNNVIIHAGCVIGSDGFGFVRDGAKNIKIPQLGVVVIDDDVEIGANTTIDRATHGETWIKRGVKTDNQVQIAHNVTVGEDAIIVAQAGISGSVRIGREVVIGGQVGIRDHVDIGDRVMIGSGSGVHKSIPEGEAALGNPTMAPRLWLKTRGLIARLPEFFKRLRDIEKKLKELEERLK